MMNIRNLGRTLVLVAVAGISGAALAQGYYGPGMGPGYGMGSGYGPGPGYGPHMGPGYGPHGYGPGGPGMMPGRPGFGPEGGPGMMRHRWEHMAQALGLSEDQRAKIARIFEDTRSRNWSVLGQIQAERYKLGEMMRGDKVDPNAAVEQKKKIDDLRTEVMRARLEARNQVLALLTPEQRDKARSLLPRLGGRGLG